MTADEKPRPTAALWLFPLHGAHLGDLRGLVVEVIPRRHAGSAYVADTRHLGPHNSWGYSSGVRGVPFIDFWGCGRFRSGVSPWFENSVVWAWLAVIHSRAEWIIF